MPVPAALRILCVGLLGCLAQPAFAADPIFGAWVNPRGSVTVDTGACKDRLCGWVSHADPQALADAADAGIPHLIGTALLQDYRHAGPGRWTGRVYVPDMGKTFYSTIEQKGPDQLKISGCILGGLICRSQLWQRVRTG